MVVACREWTQPDGDHFHGLCSNTMTPRVGASKNATPRCNACVNPALYQQCLTDPALLWKFVTPVNITGTPVSPITGTYVSGLLRQSAGFNSVTPNLWGRISSSFTRTLHTTDPTTIGPQILIPSTVIPTCRWGYSETTVFGFQLYPRIGSWATTNNVPYSGTTAVQKFSYSVSPAIYGANGSIRLAQGCLPSQPNWVWSNMDGPASQLNGLQLGQLSNFITQSGNGDVEQSAHAVGICWSWYLALDLNLLLLNTTGYWTEQSQNQFSETTNLSDYNVLYSWTGSHLGETSVFGRYSSVGAQTSVNNWSYPFTGGFAQWRTVSSTSTTITFALELKTGSLSGYTLPQTITLKRIT